METCGYVRLRVLLACLLTYLLSYQVHILVVVLRVVWLCLVVGTFEALCPGGYGYVRETRGDKIEGDRLIDR